MIWAYAIAAGLAFATPLAVLCIIFRSVERETYSTVHAPASDIDPPAH